MFEPIRVRIVPIGVMPESIWKESRLLALRGAIRRYAEVNEPIPLEWVEEYNRLHKEIQGKEMK